MSNDTIMHQGERLKELLNEKMPRQVTGLAEHLGVSRNQIYEYFKKENLHFAVLAKAANFLNVDVSEFLPVREAGEEAGKYVTGNVKSVGANYMELYTHLPFLSARAQAGLNTMSIESCELNLEETYPVFLLNVTTTKKHIVIELTGDSMEPEIKNGAIVMAEAVSKTDFKYESGGVYAVLFASRLVIKRIKTNDINTLQSLTLWSDNERYGHITIPAEDIMCMWKVIMKVNEVVR